MKEKIIGKTFTKRKKLAMILTPICSFILAGAMITTAILLRREKSITVDQGNSPVAGQTDILDIDKTSTNKTDDKTEDSQKTDSTTEKDTTVGKTDEPTNENTANEETPPVSSVGSLFADPIKEMDILHTFGFYYNNTLNSYYEHHGLDISAEAGEEVFATTDGTVSAIYLDDVLLGNSLSLDNGNGVVTVYYYIDPLETLKVGTKVNKGDVIGSVSAPTGSEYKDGAHLHMEVFENGKATDPENFLSATEK